MSRSERAFNQVKSILGKLDRSIDEARARRTSPPAVPAAAPAPAPIPAPKPQAPATPGSVYGRAKPIPPQARWD